VIERIGAGRAAVEMARELIEQHDQRQASPRARVPGSQFPALGRTHRVLEAVANQLIGLWNQLRGRGGAEPEARVLLNGGGRVRPRPEPEEQEILGAREGGHGCLDHSGSFAQAFEIALRETGQTLARQGAGLRRIDDVLERTCD